MKVIETDGRPIKAWTEGVLFEDAAQEQLRKLAAMPFIHKHIAVMPDVHAGRGSTIGTVIATRKAIIPAAVGVDLGCGMCAVKTDLKAGDLPDNLAALRSDIEAAIPVGSNPKAKIGQWGDELPDMVLGAWLSSMNPGFEKICSKHPKLVKTNNVKHLGTLGGGNHFIEICLDTEQNVWFMLHSGSRGVGNAIGRYFIEKAQREMERYFIHLPDKDMAYLPEGSEYYGDYFEAVHWAQDFAKANREIMMALLINTVEKHLNRKIKTDAMAVNCHHNYVQYENHFNENVLVTRKGAVSARKGELGIIPGSMGAKSFIVRGLGNPESFNSCSHGAGRVMSRTKAKQAVNLDDHAESLKSVECKKDATTLDETPSAYKNIDDVMKAQSDLVEIVHTLKQILCVKG